MLNPPWATCNAPAQGAATTTGDSVAIYNVRGDISDLTQMSGHTLVLEVTADLVQADFDNAKITDNNNPFVIVNMIADEGQKTVHRINFNFDGLWTDCKQVATNNQFLFQPITGETDP